MTLAEPSAPPVAPRETPFKGLAYYETGDALRFAGRERDIEAVANGILGNRTFVVYSRSGLGKTSLLMAGVFPRLADLGHRLIAVRTLKDPLRDLRAALAKQAGAEGSDAEQEGLPGLIKRVSRSQDGQDRLVVLLFDQFEEFFWRFTDQPDPAGLWRDSENLDLEERNRRTVQRQRFIHEIGRLAAAADLNLRLVFSLREDWIAEMADFAVAIPEISDHTYRLRPLTSFGVRQVIVETLRSAGAAFEAPLISALVEALAEFHFDPAILQVLCSELWDRAQARSRKEKAAIRLRLDDLTALGGIRKIFGDYLDRVQGEIGSSDLRSRIQIRAVLDALISEKQTKIAVDRDYLRRQYFAITEHELDDVLDRLYRHRLVRRDARGKEIWFELVHERLIGVILPWLDDDVDFLKFLGARNLVINSCRNRGWRENPNLLLSTGQLDDTVGPFKELLNFREDERLFLFSSAVYAPSRDLKYWADLAGPRSNVELLDRFLDRGDNEGLRQRAAEAVGRVAERKEHFAGRCFELALRDESELVRQAAARSFGDLASSDQFQELATKLRQRSNRKVTLDLLTEVVARGRVPPEIKFGRLRLWQARRKLNRRTQDAARESLYDRRLRGTVVGVEAALVWGLTAGALLVMFLLYNFMPEVALRSRFVWVIGVGVYLLATLPLGTLVARSASGRAARVALRKGREGFFFRSQVVGAGWAVALVFVASLAYVRKAGSRRVPPWLEPARPVGDSQFTAKVILSVIALALLFGLWSALIAAVARPAVWPARSRRRPWIWAWFWAFGGSLIVPLLAWPYMTSLRALENSASWRLFLVASVFSGASVLVGGLVIYVGLMAMSGSLSGGDFRGETSFREVPEAPSSMARITSRTLAVLLTAVVVALMSRYFDWGGPFFSREEVLGSRPILLREKAGRGPVGTLHVELLAPKPPDGGKLENPPSPRIAEIFVPPGWRSYGRGQKEQFSSGTVLVMQPGERRQVAFQRMEEARAAQIVIRPDAPLIGTPPDGPNLMVVRLSGKDGIWSGQLSGLESYSKASRLPQLRLAGVGQAGICADAGALELRIGRGAEASQAQVASLCASSPKRIEFWRSQAPGFGRRLGGGASAPSAIAPVEIDIHNAVMSSGGLGILELTASAHIPEDVPPHDLSTGSADLSADGTQVATAAGDEPNIVYLWSLNAPGKRTAFRHSSRVLRADLSRDGKRLIVNTENAVQIWKLDGSGASTTIPGRASQTALSPDGTRVIVYFHRESGDSDSAGASVTAKPPPADTLRLWSVDGPLKLVATLQHERRIASLAFSPDGRRIGAVEVDGSTRIWRTDGSDAGRPKVLIKNARPPSRGDSTEGDEELGLNPVFDAPSFAKRIAFSPDGSRLVDGCGTDAGTMCVWTIDSSSKPILLKHPLYVYSVAFSPDGARILTACADHLVRIWNADGQGEPRTLVKHDEEANSAVFSPDGTHVATASDDRTVRVVRVDGTEPTILAHRNPVYKVEFSDDGDHLLTLDEGGFVRTWNLARSSVPKTVGDLYLFFRLGSAPAAAPEKRSPFLPNGPTTLSAELWPF